MDQTLADFVAQTGADSGLARDILAGKKLFTSWYFEMVPQRGISVLEKNWDIASALKAYSTLTQLKSSESSSGWSGGTVCVNGKVDSDQAKKDNGGDFV